MGKRRAGRELAFRILFQIEVAETPQQEALEMAFQAANPDEETAAFARRLVEETESHLKEIDQLLSQFTEHWSLDRMANVDRCLLRLAAAEIRYFSDIPASVSVDEAVELAKKYSTADSGRFINGVLGSLIRKTMPETQTEA